MVYSIYLFFHVTVSFNPRCLPARGALRLIREAKGYTKRRVHKPLQLALFGQLCRVRIELGLVLVVQVDNRFVGLDARVGHGLGQHRAAARQVVAQQNGTGLDVVLLGNLDNGLGREQGAAGAAKGAVGHDVDALFAAEVDDFLLGKGRVVLDLVDGGDNLGDGEEFLEVLFAVLSSAER